MAGFGNAKLVDVKNLFFDRQKISKAVGKAKLRFLSKAGAFVMTAARRSIRKSKKPSKPGRQPHGHNDQLLKKNIFFGIDKSISNPDCLAGPVALNSVSFTKDGTPVRGKVPSVLEKGGELWILEVFKWGKWSRANLRSKRRLSGLPIRYRRVAIEARPFMRPALDISRPKFSSMWLGLLKKG